MNKLSQDPYEMTISELNRIHQRLGRMSLDGKLDKDKSIALRSAQGLVNDAIRIIGRVKQ